MGTRKAFGSSKQEVHLKTVTHIGFKHDFFTQDLTLVEIEMLNTFKELHYFIPCPFSN
jgi:hypothetical protein